MNSFATAVEQILDARVADGLPRHVEDEGALARVASILGAPKARKREAADRTGGTPLDTPLEGASSNVCTS